MKPKTRRDAAEEPEPQAETETPFKDDGDICQQLMSRYSASTAPQHRHLLATAAAIRSILSAESLPLTPPTYFSRAISNVADSKNLDSTEVAALLSFISIVAPLIPENGIDAEKASVAVEVLVGAVTEREGLGVASVRGVVKCLGVLIWGFCNLEDWGSVKYGFESLLKFSIDKRPKVRRSAQDYLERVFKSFRSSDVINEASKLVLSSLRSYMPVALLIIDSKVTEGSKDEALSKPEHLEVLYMLNVVKLIVPYLAVKIGSKVLLETLRLMRTQFGALTRHVLKIIDAFFETSKDEVICSQAEKIIDLLCSYVCLVENPIDTVLSAANLLKIALNKLHAGESTSWMMNFPRVCASIAGLLMNEATIASQASNFLKELINQYIDPKVLLTAENQSFGDLSDNSAEAEVIKSTCAIFYNSLSSCNGIPNEHLLRVISVLFLKLEEFSLVYTKDILLKLANLMKHASQATPDLNHLQNCIGSAVVAMGPEKILSIIPISVNEDDISISNIWLVSILKKYVVGASLGYYMEHIVPLAKSLQRASRRVKKSAIGKDLQAHAHDLFGLLPSFCRFPVDTHRNFRSMAQLLVTFLKKDFMHQNVAVALQVLVKQNRSIISSKANPVELNSNEALDSITEFRSLPAYSEKTATRNIRALNKYSTELLQALADLFVASPLEERLYIKDAIGCLTSITDSTITKRIFMSLLERFQFINDGGEFEKIESCRGELSDKEQGNLRTGEKAAQRCVMMELASSLIEGAKEDLVDLIYNFVAHFFRATGIDGHCEGYHTLSRILEEHIWFRSSRFIELIDLLLGHKPPADVTSLRHRFACFHFLMVHSLEINSEEENAKAFLILNEMILTLKDGREEVRKVAYDALIMMSAFFRNSSDVSSEPYQKLISMIMGYLSGSSPQIKSGAVSALSVLLYNDPDICLKMPDLVPTLLSLLQSKAVEVIKATLGFAKVLVSSLETQDLQNLLSDIITAVLPWSFVSRNHFRTKVTVILEIMIRKCGSAVVESIVPEKYKFFLKTVLQNRHHKSTSKETGTEIIETVPEKQKQNELETTPEGNRSAHRGKRKREEKQNKIPPGLKDPKIVTGDGGGLKGSKRARRSMYQKSIKFRSEDTKKKRTFNKEAINSGKRKVSQKNRTKKGDGVVKGRGSPSKFDRHNRGWKKQKMGDLEYSSQHAQSTRVKSMERFLLPI